MYQHFFIILASEEDLNQYKFINLKIHRDFIFSSSKPDILDLINEYCPRDDNDVVQLTNLLITSTTGLEFRYYWYNDKLFVRCEDLFWEQGDDGLFRSKIKINILHKDDYGMDDNLLLFKNEDMEEFVNDVNNPFYLEMTGPYYTNQTPGQIDCSFMQLTLDEEQLTVNIDNLNDLIETNIMGIKATEENDYTILDFGNNYSIHIIDPENLPDDYDVITVLKDDEIILTKGLDEWLYADEIFDIDNNFNFTVQDISTDGDRVDLDVTLLLHTGDIDIRCCDPETYKRFSKFDQNDEFYFAKTASGRWIKDNEYQKNLVKYIIDFTKINSNKALQIVNAETIDIHTEFTYKNSSSINKTHYIGILDSTDHMPCDFKSLIGFNVSDTLSIGKDQTTIIYSNAIDVDKEEDLVLTDEEGSYWATNNQDIGVPIDMILKYDNTDLTIIQDSVLTREWLKLGEGCGFND